MIKSIGYTAKHSFNSLKPHEFEREDPKENEVAIDILFCGVCHSDIHQVKNDWSNTVYPVCPGTKWWAA
jgi:alcohol dehydrogenase (NADP+)